MPIPKPPFCPLTGGNCGITEGVINQRLASKPYVFVAMPFSKLFDDTESVIRAIVDGGFVFSEKYEAKKMKDKKLAVVTARDERFIGQGVCKICQLCWYSDFGIAELGSLNSNVIFEIGLLFGFGKRVIFTLDLSQTVIEDIPFDLRNQLLIPYESILRLSKELEDKINFIIITT